MIKFRSTYLVNLTRNSLLVTCSLLFTQWLIAQPERWQQAVKYTMEVDMNVENHQFTGIQKLEYTNNSPDTLTRAFYHLYLNAFQPNSMMDVRSRTISDPDRRVRDRISKLSEDEIGFTKVQTLKMNGIAVPFEIVGTILEADLPQSILPGQTVTFDMTFNSQVPLQVRRNGRDSEEGVDYSMAQWYPKMCNYDYQGWHANPYIGREFYGIWGDFDVKITIDAEYVVGATGVLQNPKEVGHGYGGISQPPSTDKITYHFLAENVHDFVWGADTDYEHIVEKAANGVEMHFFYIPGPKTTDNWKALPAVMSEVFSYLDEHAGKYPYPVYAFIQGGDGGMEYPMATLITGQRSFGSLVGVSIHELVHSWYQMILGSNEALYAWMDEGFTSFTSAYCTQHLKKKGLLKGEINEFATIDSYAGYFNLVKSNMEEPLSTHADHFNTNFAYSLASYAKGAVFLQTMDYLMGHETFKKAILRYYNTWKFKHPNVNDVVRCMEQESGLELDWFKENFVYTTKVVDYGIEEVSDDGRGNTRLLFERIQPFPMPIDFVVTDKSGKKSYYTIPLRIMRGAKQQDSFGRLTVLEDWPWTHPTYECVLPIRFENVHTIEIDPTQRLPDYNASNNVYKK